MSNHCIPSPSVTAGFKCLASEPAAKILAHAIVVESEIDVVRQENLITRMERDGKDTIEAKTLLITMRTKLVLQRQARRRILDLLDR